LPAERAIGACGPRLFPRLYVCCGLVPTLPGELGIGGVPVAAVLDGSQDSQWLGVADYILRGDPAKTLPALLEAMRRPEAAVGQPDPQTSTADGTAATREP
jgi:electron transfer flavoprotein alpha subunit